MRQGSPIPIWVLGLHHSIRGSPSTATVSAYVRDIATVQIWCAWAELLLGEASFSKPILASRGR